MMLTGWKRLAVIPGGWILAGARLWVVDCKPVRRSWRGQLSSGAIVASASQLGQRFGMVCLEGEEGHRRREGEGEGEVGKRQKVRRSERRAFHGSGWSLLHLTLTSSTLHSSLFLEPTVID